MVFQNIFDFSKSGSDTTSATESGIAGYLATQPAEAITVPPHDPSQPFVDNGLRDPKIVRETLPEAQGLFDWIASINTAIKLAADKQASANADPSTTVKAAQPIMTSAASFNSDAMDTLTKPKVNPPAQPTVAPPAQPTAPEPQPTQHNKA